jgi:hypothetical protein
MLSDWLDQGFRIHTRPVYHPRDRMRRELVAAALSENVQNLLRVGDTWLFRYLISASMHVDFLPIRDLNSITISL